MDPIWKRDKARYKDTKQGKHAEDPPRHSGKAKKVKPVVVKYRYTKAFPLREEWRLEWRTFGRYRTRGDAEKAVADQQRKHPGWYEFTISGETPE